MIIDELAPLLCDAPFRNMNFNLLADAVNALYDEEATLDDVLSKSLDTFQGSMASFTRCVEGCSANTHDPVSAACNILVRLFESTVEHEQSAKIEPFAFDEAAVILRETEHLARTVKVTSDKALESLRVAATRCGIPAPAYSSNLSSNNSVTEVAQAARDGISALNEALGVFLKDAVRLFDVRIVAPVEIEKRLNTCHEQWHVFSASQRQQVSLCVAAELQCRLEWKWFASFLNDIRGSGALNVADDYALPFEQQWLRNWNRRREALQDQFSLVSETILSAAKTVVAKFPVDEATPETSFVLDLRAKQPLTTDFKFVKTQRVQRPEQFQVAHRQAIRRPLESLRKALEFSAPSPMLTVVTVVPECNPPQLVQPVAHQILHRPSSRTATRGGDSPLVVRRLS